MTEALSPLINTAGVFEALFANLEEGVIVVDEEGRVALSNQKALALLSTSEEDVQGKTFSEVWDRRAFNATLKTLPIGRGAGKSGAIMLFREWKEREVDRARTELLSLAAHQLRTPLTAVKLFTEMLLSDRGFSTEQQEILASIERSNEKMINLIEHFLSLGAKSEGQLKIRRVPVDLRRFLERIIADMEPFAELKKVRIVCADDAIKNRTTDIDPHLLREVIDNLLNNAICYSLPSSVVTVRLEEESGTYIVSVADTGIGIPDSLKENIFKKHYRAPNAKKVNADGTGLGLYMCDIIMESLGGKIWFVSKAGKGTTFSISF
jgi:signal transduction histidine kinase